VLSAPSPWCTHFALAHDAAGRKKVVVVTLLLLLHRL
jgi:hypothetical protein